MLAWAAPSPAAQVQRVLFVGNSFTFGANSPAWHYRAASVHDLNDDGVGGVPALFRQFTEEAGLDYRVSVETDAGQTLGFHLEQRRSRLDRAWDQVVLQEYSTLDPHAPGNPSAMARHAQALAALFSQRNPRVRVYLQATWSRPDQTFPAGGHWHGQPITAMAEDIQRAEGRVAAGDPRIAGVVPVGRAFNRAIATGVADANPYDGTDYGKVDLWSFDHYHASVYGYYLAALMDFGRLTGRDPRVLGADEQAARELGLSPAQAVALQRVAFEELAAGRPR